MHIPGLSCSGWSSHVLLKCTDSVGCAFFALPRSEPLRWPVAWQAHCSRWAVCLNHFLVPATRFPGCEARAPSQACCVSPLGGWSQVWTLLAVVNNSGSQEDVVSNWEPAHSWVEDASLWGRDCPCLPALTVACLPLCLGRWGSGLYTAD